jgi:predicted MPP superfamily phosphohydrolase
MLEGPQEQWDQTRGAGRRGGIEDRARIEEGDSRLKAWPVVGLFLIEALLLLAHWFIFHTWIAFWGLTSAGATTALRATLFGLALSFVVAALLSFRFANGLVIFIYRIAATWLGFMTMFLVAAFVCWGVWYGVLLARVSDAERVRAPIAGVVFAAAVVAGVYGILNALWVRVRRVTVVLPGLPAVWKGRTALLMSDLHLGHVNRLGFCRKIVAKAVELKPDIVFLPGDLFDGGKIEAERIAAPLAELKPPLGKYFSTGNHDEFGNVAEYTEVLTGVGFRVLNNEKVVVDGLHVLGIPYHDSNYPMRMRATLEGMRVPQGEASILLSHVPNRLPIVEQAGVSLQLSGHTHGGQIFPFTWVVRRAFGKFTYGLHRFGALQVYTSYGAGTWGPPMRVGTHAEMVLIRFG